MFIGPLIRILYSTRGPVEITTLRFVNLLVFVRFRAELKGLSYRELCQGVQGLVVCLSPEAFDRIVKLSQGFPD